MNYGIALLNKERTRVVCIAHNIVDTGQLNALLDKFEREGTSAIHFTHAMDHSGKPSTCPGCYAALEEGLKIAEEDHRRERGLTTPPSKTGPSSSSPSLLGGALQAPNMEQASGEVPRSKEVGKTAQV